MNDKFDRVIKIMTWMVSFTSLIISIIALTVNRQMYELSVKENLFLNAEVKDVTILKLVSTEAYDDTNYSLYLVNLTMCFVNNSNLPIYVDYQNFYGYNPVPNNYKRTIILEMNEVDLPIYIAPQETIFVDYQIKVPIPKKVNESIIEEFGDSPDLDIMKVGEYLFFEKSMDLTGNNVDLRDRFGTKYYRYNPSILTWASFGTTRWNTFYTEFSLELHLPDWENLDEKYKDVYYRIEYGEGDIFDKIQDFIEKNKSSIIDTGILIILIIVVFLWLKCFYKKILNEIR